MTVEVLPVRSDGDCATAGQRAARALAAGGVVVHPTETVYGLGGDGTPASNRWIARIKKREGDRPLLLLVPDLRTLRRFLPELDWPEAAEKLANRFWPGPLTLIVPCRLAPAGLAGPDGGVAVRVSPDPVIAAIFRYWRHPITSTSANLAGQPPAPSLEQALALFEDREDLSRSERPIVGLDAGPIAGGGRPSTILTLVEQPPGIVRSGPIAREEIAEVLPELKGS